MKESGTRCPSFRRRAEKSLMASSPSLATMQWASQSHGEDVTAVFPPPVPSVEEVTRRLASAFFRKAPMKDCHDDDDYFAISSSPSFGGAP